MGAFLLCIPGYPGTLYVNQAGLNADLSASASAS